MATNDEEEVPRFGLRRGARFLQTLREQAGSDDADDEWLAGLRPDSADEAVTHYVGAEGNPADGPGERDVGAPAARARAEPVPAPQPRPAGHAPPDAALEIVPALGDALNTLEERLSALEEALARAAAACTVSRMVLRNAKGVTGDHSHPLPAPPPPPEPEP